MRYGAKARIEELPDIMSVDFRIKKKEKMMKSLSAKITFLWLVLLSPFMLLSLVLYLTSIGIFGTLPSFEQLENPKNSLATEIISEDGKLLGKYFYENRTNVKSRSYHKTY